MNEKYTIDEILIAVNDLQKIKKKKGPIIISPPVKNNIDIPKNTLRLIEEAENKK
jgi:hypothetical protein